MFVLIIGILLIAVLADLATYRIPNALILIGLLLGLAYSFIDKGPPGIADSLFAVIISFILFYFLYIIKALGAGDIKLLLVLASFLGVRFTIKILIASLIVGTVYGCIKMLCSSIFQKVKSKKKRKRGDFTKVKNSQQFDLFIFILLEKIKGKTREVIDKKNVQFTHIRFSPAILVGFLFVWKMGW